MTNMTEIEKLVDELEDATCDHHDAIRLAVGIREATAKYNAARAALLAAIRDAVQERERTYLDMLEQAVDLANKLKLEKDRHGNL